VQRAVQVLECGFFDRMDRIFWGKGLLGAAGEFTMKGMKSMKVMHYS